MIYLRQNPCRLKNLFNTIQFTRTTAGLLTLFVYNNTTNLAFSNESSYNTSNTTLECFFDEIGGIDQQNDQQCDILKSVKTSIIYMFNIQK